MKHTDWLRLKSEGDCICANLRQQGYQCRKQTRRLSWKLFKEGQDDYVLTWLPAPISDWSLIPNNTSPARTQLWQLIERSLNQIRGAIGTTSSQRHSQVEAGLTQTPSFCPPNPSTLGGVNPVPPKFEGLGGRMRKSCEDYSRPWAIMRLLPNAQRYTIARFFNRQDAEDHKRFLNRYMPAAEFEIIFDIPNELTPTTGKEQELTQTTAYQISQSHLEME